MAEIINTTKDDRILKGSEVFKWEDNPGLGHHCGICAKPFTKDSSRVTCVGKHGEPCIHFHQILHFLGKAHECQACDTSEWMHYCRHKEIITLVRKISEIDKAETILAAPRLKKRHEDSVQNGNESELAMTETSSDLPTDTPRLTKRERKRQRRSGIHVSSGKHALDVFTWADSKLLHEAIHYPIADDEPVPALENNSEQSTPKDNSNSINRTTTSLLARQSRYRNNGKTQRGSKQQKSVFNGVDPEIFARLGVNMSPAMCHDSKRKELVVKLVEAVRNDLEVVQHEEYESNFREVAFYRWAGRNVKAAMDEAHEHYDWATGAIIKTFKFPKPSAEALRLTAEREKREAAERAREETAARNRAVFEEERREAELQGQQEVRAPPIQAATATPARSVPRPSGKRTIAILRIISIPPEVPKMVPAPVPSKIITPRKPKAKRTVVKQDSSVSSKSDTDDEESFDPEDLKFLVAVQSSRK